ERTARDVERREALEERGAELRRQPGADFGGEVQLLAVVVPDEHGIHVRTGRLVAADDELLARAEPDLDPRAAPPAWLVDRLPLLRDDALEAEGADRFSDLRRRPRERLVQQHRRARDDARERAAAILQGRPHQIAAVEVQEIERVEDDRSRRL